MQEERVQELVTTTADQIGLVFRTKAELYYFLSSTGKNNNSFINVTLSIANVFLPPLKTIDIYFLKQLMMGEKKAFNRSKDKP